MSSCAGRRAPPPYDTRLKDTPRSIEIMRWVKEAIIAINNGANVFSIKTHRLIKLH